MGRPVRPWFGALLLTIVLLAFSGPSSAAPVSSAVPMASLSIVERTATATVPVREVASVIARCRAGEVVTGGGYELQSIHPDVQVFTNAPIQSPTGRWGWAINLHNDTDASFDFTAFAMCARFTP
jgi:hypothetical protein